MLTSLIAIGAVALIAYMWSARGFLSSFLHMLCVLVAGAIAFSVWEPLGVKMLESSGTGMLADSAWALALAGPFIVALIITRIALDKLVPANTQLSTPANMVGGAVCGLVSGVITIGIALMSVGYMRISPDLGMSYQPVKYASKGGSLVREDGLIVPVDRLTSSLYEKLSEGLFRPIGGESLRRWHPDAWEEGTLLRTNFEDGKSRNTLSPGDYEIVGYYIYAPKNPAELLSDGFQKTAQPYQFLAGDAGTVSPSQIFGVVVKFKAGAKEKSGRVVVGAGQVRLIVQTDPNSTSSVLPIQPAAVISPAEAARPTLGRWRFDTKDVYIASMGARDDVVMAFEFPAPKDSTPIAMYLRGARQELTGKKPLTTFDSQAKRDDAIRSMSIGANRSAGDLKRDGAVTIKTESNATPDNMLRLDTSLPLGMVLTKDGLKGLAIDETNGISGGELSKFDQQDMNNRGVDLNLAVRKFASTDDTVLIQLVADRTNSRFGLLSSAADGADRSKPPVLVDNNGATYSPIGFIYRDTKEVWIYFNPQSPVQAIDGDPLPGLSKSKPDQQLTLVYRVSRGVKITSFAIGDKVVAEFKPAIDAAR